MELIRFDIKTNWKYDLGKSDFSSRKMLPCWVLAMFIVNCRWPLWSCRVIGFFLCLFVLFCFVLFCFWLKTAILATCAVTWRRDFKHFIVAVLLIYSRKRVMRQVWVVCDKVKDWDCHSNVEMGVLTCIWVSVLVMSLRVTSKPFQWAQSSFLLNNFQAFSYQNLWQRDRSKGGNDWQWCLSPKSTWCCL